MDELLSEFLQETEEALATLDLEIVQLEQNPNNPELLANIFRLVHTIKGTCGFLGLPRLEKVAHHGENVLGKFRDGDMEVKPEAVSLILESLDRIKEILAVLAEQEAEPVGDDMELIRRLDQLYETGHLDGPDSAAPAAAEPAPVQIIEAAQFDDSDEHGFTPTPATWVPDDAPAEVAEEAVVEEAPVAEAAPAPAAEAAPAAPAAGNAGGNKGGKKKDIASQSIRVSVDLLEDLMTMVSELVLTRNQLLQLVRNNQESEFRVPLQRLSHVTTELQEGVMKTRMQPIGNAWAKLPRIVRDLSLELGKKIDLEMLGADTELDRQVLELIKDPLTHMVRNSADHGLEGPEERLAAGKSETGKVILNAYHEGGHILIEIKDDGRGIDTDKVKQKAIDNGLASEAEVDGMSDQQILQFIFKAGLSTAKAVTNVSGRGVGMDVVRTNIEKIGGTVDLKSERGKGSIFIIKIPLTLAIVSALIVECARERFAIPQISVVELVRASDDTEHRIETINETPVLRLRDRLLPLVSMRQLLRLDNGEAPVDLAEGELEEADRESFIVVTQVGNYKYGVVVDRVFDTEEIVVKPVAPILRDIGLFSGNTILGDGTVIMILDPNGLADATGEISLADAAVDDEAMRNRKRDDRVALLVFRAGSEEPKAVPLSLVARLEEIDVSTIEQSTNMMMVQYRGQLMPLVMTEDEATMREEGRQPILVFADNERSMGLVVDEIVDIVEDRLDIEIASARQGVLGSAVVSGKATEVIDAGYYLTKAFGDWFRTHEDAAFGDGAGGKANVLLVDDSPFFRSLLQPLLEVAGFRVIAAESADEALKMRGEGEMFNAIISDIEMPGMNGFDFAQEVRAGGAWAELPLIALSSHATPKDLERGREAGFTDYVAKFDRDALLVTLQETLAGAAA